MNILATSFGSAGDFLPTLAVAASLRERGHDVRFVANPFFEPQVRRAGLPFLPAGGFCDLAAAFEANPKYLNSLRGGRAVWDDFAAPNILATYAAIREAIRADRPGLVLCNNVSFGGVWAAAESGVRYALTASSPLAWINPRAPMIVSEWVPPRWLQRSIAHVAHWGAGEVLTRSLAKLAAKLTPAPDPSFRNMERMAALHLGLWSSTIRAKLPGDPPQSLVCGFARAGHFGAEEDAPEVEAFLSAGPPPVVVGLGSAYAVTSGALLRVIQAACERAGLRCLIVGHPAGETHFGGSTLAVRYAPYQRVFPRAAAVVIHGGAGTAAEALCSGRPILAMPFAFDQFLMAQAVERAGVGIWVRKRRRSRDEIATDLTRLVSSSSFAQRAAKLADTLSSEPDGARAAAEAIELLC